MATLKDGLYHIRFVPSGIHPPFNGGLYATASEIGEPVLAEVQGTKPTETWKVTRNDNGKYIITQPGFQTRLAGIGPVLMGWSLSNPSPKFPGGSILFKPDYAELELQPEGEGENVIYGLKVPNPAGIHSPSLDFEFFVTEDDHKLVSQAFWSTLRVHHPHPHWQFIPASSK